MHSTRRNFFKKSTLGAAAIAGAPLLASANQAISKPVRIDTTSKGDTFKFAVAGYTFHKFSLEQTLAMMKQVDLKHLCIKDFHLPLNADAERIAAFHKQCQDSGVTGYGVGPIYMSSPEEARRAFEYAKRVGVNVVVGVPFKTIEKKRFSSPELLAVINDLVQEFNIKYAIHNHGPDMPELFPTAESGIELIDKMDKRVGLCLDIGHQYRDGRCPIKAMLDFSDRIHDIHIKNVTANNKGGRSIEMPRGKIDLVAFVEALRKVKYSGACSLEYEKDMSDPMMGIAESVGYFRGIMDATRGRS